ncbi:hypothetical protein [Shinella sp. DD12]|nr:hypothetical protein [Shinella sp. DD12]EYR81883.1 hypothetical protein SHLA_4c001750 [Shinella sp. DD12]
MTRILAAALCCLLLASCGSLSDRQRDADWGQSGGVLNYTERTR